MIYKALTPISHDNKNYSIGETVPLTDTQATPLSFCNAVVAEEQLDPVVQTQTVVEAAPQAADVSAATPAASDDGEADAKAKKGKAA